MKKDWLVKILALVIVLMFFSTGFIPITNGISQEKQESIVNEISDSTVSNIEGLPDLVIEGLGTEPGTLPFEYEVFCRFKNIGSGVADDFIDLKVEMKRVFLGLFLINKTIYSTFANIWEGGYAPGETGTLEFDYISYLPAWGFFRIYCYINPNKRIEEENYDNNLYIRNVFVLFGDWVKAIG